MERVLTARERAVLDAFLALEFVGVEIFREQGNAARVVDTCGCGCPSIDFTTEPGTGITILVEASVRESADTLFLYAVNDHLGGIEYISKSTPTVTELPDPDDLQLAAHPRTAS